MTTDRFEGLARLQARALGRPELKLAVIQHPLAGLDPETARERGRAIAGRILGELAAS